MTKLYLTDCSSFRLSDHAASWPALGTNYVSDVNGVSADTYLIPGNVSAINRLTPDMNGYTSAYSASGSTVANNVNSQMHRLSRHVSTPMTSAGSILCNGNTAYTMVYFALQSNTNVNLYTTTPMIWIWRPSSSSVVGILNNVVYNSQTTASEPAGSTAPNYYSFAAQHWLTNTNQTTVSWQVGDVLVVDVMARFTQGMSTIYSIATAWGGDTERAYGTTPVLTTNPAPWIDISYSFSFETPKSYLTPLVDGQADVRYTQPFTFLSSTTTAGATVNAILTDGLLSQAHISASPLISANLTTSILMQTSVQSIARTRGFFPQDHGDLSVSLSATPEVTGILPTSTPMANLGLWYSGGVENSQPSLSLGGQASGVRMQDQLSSMSVIIGGVEILFSSSFRFSPTLSYFSATKRLLLQVGGLSFDQYIVPEVPLLAMGSNEEGYLMLRVYYDQLPTSDVVSTITQTNLPNKLFPDPDMPTLLAGKTEYRCLYLKNIGQSDVYSVVLKVSGPTVETVTLGTEYVPSFVLGDPSEALNLQPSSNSAAITGRAGPYTLDPVAQYGLEGQSGGAPYVFISNSSGQASDGVEIDLPLTIADQEDSTNVLSGMVFSDQLSWPVVKAGKSVTFWVKKVQPPSPTIPTFESLRFEITAAL